MADSHRDRLQFDGADLVPDGVEEYYQNQSGALLNDNFGRDQYSKQSIQRNVRQFQFHQECNEIPEESIMWHVIPRDHLPEEGSWLDDLEQAGAYIISDFYEVCAPAEAESPSKFRATFPINDEEPGVNYGELESGSKTVRRVFVLHYSETHGLQCSKPESISEDGTQATVVVDHFSWFGFIKSESMVLMMAYDEDYEHFSALCCKEAYFISEEDHMSILEYNGIDELLQNAQAHIDCKQDIYDETDDFRTKRESKRSLQATKYLMKCFDSIYHAWEIVPISSIFGNEGKYRYHFHDETKAKIAESKKFKCKLERVAEDRYICDSDQKERLKTFSVDIIKPIFGRKHQYGPYHIRRRKVRSSNPDHRRHSSDASLTASPTGGEPMSDIIDEPSLSLHSMHIGFHDVDADEARDQIIQHLQRKIRLMTPNDLKKMIAFLFRKESDEQCTVQELQDYLRPLTNAPEPRFYYGRGFMNGWGKLQGHASLDEALYQSRMRKIAVVLACHKNRGNMTPQHCIEQQLRIERTLEEHNGYEIIHVGNRTQDQPPFLRKEHFAEALQAIGKAISDPGDNGPVIGVMIWILGHGGEERNMGMVDVGAEAFEELLIARQKLRTDYDEEVNVNNFIDELGDFARGARETNNPPFPIIVTNQFCRNSDGGAQQNLSRYMREPPEDVFVINAASSGQLAQDKNFVDQWLGKYVHDFKEQPLELTTIQVENIVAHLNHDQRPEHQTKLEPKYTCKNGIYEDYFIPASGTPHYL